MSSTNKMKYELKSLDTYRKDNPVTINFVLQNLSDEELWVLTWYTPLEGIKGNIFRVICDGMEILYEGIMVKRGKPRKNDYLYIEPGGSASRDVDLSNAYKLPVTQECDVQFEGKIYDFSTSGDAIPKMAGGHQTVNITGNSVKFSVVNN
jgi:hypothetical protein